MIVSSTSSAAVWVRKQRTEDEGQHEEHGLAGAGDRLDDDGGRAERGQGIGP